MSFWDYLVQWLKLFDLHESTCCFYKILTLYKNNLGDWHKWIGKERKNYISKWCVGIHNFASLIRIWKLSPTLTKPIKHINIKNKYRECLYVWVTTYWLFLFTFHSFRMLSLEAAATIISSIPEYREQL